MAPAVLTKHNCPRSEKEDNMNETEAFITQLCESPGRCDFHCRGELRRAGMHHGAGWGKGVIGS